MKSKPWPKTLVLLALVGQKRFMVPSARAGGGARARPWRGQALGPSPYRISSSKVLRALMYWLRLARLSSVSST